MKRANEALLTGLLTCLLTCLLAGAATGADAPDPAEPDPSQEVRVPIVVELFTSQGCSSCPPADRLLSHIAELAGPGVEPLTLAFHVDYWDRLGWRDPFSSPEWSARQSRYAQAFGSNRVYTPQLVVDGRLETVGSDERAVRRLLAEATHGPRGEIALEARLGPRTLTIDASAALAASLAEAPCELMVAVVESGLVTEVESGENEDRRLANDAVVRQLERLGTVVPGAAPIQVEGFTLRLAKTWSQDRLEIVAWLQDPQTMAILGGARARPAASRGE
ncbi:MAG: DUF1223 domain-containing protein [Thermoanaerobaculia bacterium]|nr:DUF1223 domain-containing protein [Thermoanaerobaculia bacterium]